MLQEIQINLYNLMRIVQKNFYNQTTIEIIVKIKYNNSKSCLNGGGMEYATIIA